jgi:hypothetical protein
VCAAPGLPFRPSRASSSILIYERASISKSHASALLPVRSASKSGFMGQEWFLLFVVSCCGWMTGRVFSGVRRFLCGRRF